MLDGAITAKGEEPAAIPEDADEGLLLDEAGGFPASPLSGVIGG
ncbi:MAG: hypothetical protein JWO89_1919, partial [Verrucomicrobiaceae bacterium]|nr:hypothetical protein [Verrucomicrobiaceae bacterium]